MKNVYLVVSSITGTIYGAFFNELDAFKFINAKSPLLIIKKIQVI
jgi:hypothetical protein